MIESIYVLLITIYSSNTKLRCERKMSISIRNLGLVGSAAIAIALGTTLVPVQAKTLVTQTIPDNLDLVDPLDNFSQDNPEDPFNQ